LVQEFHLLCDCRFNCSHTTKRMSSDSYQTCRKPSFHWCNEILTWLETIITYLFTFVKEFENFQSRTTLTNASGDLFKFNKMILSHFNSKILIKEMLSLHYYSYINYSKNSPVSFSLDIPLLQAIFFCHTSTLLCLLKYYGPFLIENHFSIKILSKEPLIVNVAEAEPSRCSTAATKKPCDASSVKNIE